MGRPISMPKYNSSNIMTELFKLSTKTTKNEPAEAFYNLSWIITLFLQWSPNVSNKSLTRCYYKIFEIINRILSVQCKSKFLKWHQPNNLNWPPQQLDTGRDNNNNKNNKFYCHDSKKIDIVCSKDKRV